MNTSKWFDRKFNFNFGPEEYTAIYERLQQAPDMLANVLTNKPEHMLSYQPDGKWSVKEHTGHLAILESLWRTRIHDIIEKKAVLTPADLDNKSTSEAGFNNYSITELLQSFNKERKDTLSLLDSIDVAKQGYTSIHPRLQQPMRMIDILYFTMEHDDHHIGVIKGLIE